MVNNPRNESERCSSVGSFNIPGTAAPGTAFEFLCWIKLFTAGIYYRVTGRSEKIGSFSGDYRFKLSVVTATAEIRRKPCSNSEVTSHGVGIKSNTLNDNDPVWEAYSKAWNVKQIYMYIQTRGEFGNSNDDGILVYYSPIVGVNL